MRIAHFLQRYPPALGGSEAYFARLSRFLVERGHQVVVFTTTALDLEAFVGKGRQLRPGTSHEDGVLVRRFPVRSLPVGHAWLTKALSLLPVRSWQRLVTPFNPVVPDLLLEVLRTHERFDLIHAACFPYSGPMECARLLARRIGVPFALTPFVHTGNPDDPLDRTRRAYTRPWLVDLARQADAVFVQTEGERRALAERGVAVERLVLQGLGVDRSSCTEGDRARARRRWRVQSGETVVGHLANNSHEKGTVALLGAAQHVWDQGGPVRVVLAGPETARFRTFREHFRVRGPLVRLGPLSADEKRDFFAGIDVFALPSTSDSFGLVLPEAWSNGVPCVVVNAGGPPWVVRHEQDGLVVPCGDPIALARALLRLARDEQLRHRLGRAGQERSATDFDWKGRLAVVEETGARLVAPEPQSPVRG